MDTLFLLLKLGLALFVLTWVAVFGGVGAVIAPRRGRTPLRGFVIGLLPVAGWVLLAFWPGAWRRAAGRVKNALAAVFRGAAAKVRGGRVPAINDTSDSIHVHNQISRNARVLEPARKVGLHDPDLPIQ